MAATLRDIAARTNVSVSTVSRVFSSPNLFTPETVRKVLDAAAELEYSPNPIARALITGTSKNIGLIVPDIANPFNTYFLKYAQQYARSLGYAVFLGNTDEDSSLERELSQQLLPQAHGLILFAPRMSSKHITALAAKTRVVVVNRPIKDVPSVLIDSAVGTRASVEYLRDLGHRHVAYVPGPRRSWANRERLRAVTECAKKCGMTLAVLPSTNARHEDGIAVAGAVVEAGVTAVVAFDDLLAFGMIEGLRRRGCEVPSDISLTGHDDVLGAVTSPPLTTVSGRADAAAQTAIDLLLRHRNGAGAGPSTTTTRLRTELVIRESAAAPAGTARARRRPSPRRVPDTAATSR